MSSQSPKTDAAGDAPEGRGGAPGAPSGLSTMPKYNRTVAGVLAEHSAYCGDFPVSGVEIFRRDAVTRRVGIIGSRRVPVRQDGEGDKWRVKGASDRAMRRLLFCAKNCDADFRSMITLTYPKAFSSDGRTVKRHFEAFRQDYLETFQSRGLWWLEFQMRGAPHYHVLCEENLEDHGEIVTRIRRTKRKVGTVEYRTNDDCADWLAHRWYHIVGSRDPKHLKAGTAWEVVEAEEGAWVYAAAHAGKRHQKKVPEGYLDVGRFWGKIGDLRVERMGLVKMDTEGVYATHGSAAMSSEGKVKKYLYDAAPKFIEIIKESL